MIRLICALMIRLMTLQFVAHFANEPYHERLKCATKCKVYL